MEPKYQLDQRVKWRDRVAGSEGVIEEITITIDHTGTLIIYCVKPDQGRAEFVDEGEIYELVTSIPDKGEDNV